MADNKAFRIRRRDSSGDNNITTSNDRKKLRFEPNVNSEPISIGGNKNILKVIDTPKALIPTKDPDAVLAAVEARKKARMANIIKTTNDTTKQHNNPIKETITIPGDIDFSENSIIDKMDNSSLRNHNLLNFAEEEDEINEEDKDETSVQQINLDEQYDKEMEDIIGELSNIERIIKPNERSEQEGAIEDFINSIGEDCKNEEEESQEHIETNYNEVNQEDINSSFVMNNFQVLKFKYHEGINISDLENVNVHYFPNGDYNYNNILKMIGNKYWNGILKAKQINTNSLYWTIFGDVLNKVYKLHGKELSYTPNVYYDDGEIVYHIIILDQQIKINNKNYYVFTEIEHDKDYNNTVKINSIILIENNIIFSIS